MGVANKQYSASDVEAAIFRTEGVKPANLQFGPATNPDPAAGFRRYTPTGAGHLMVHMDSGIFFDGPTTTGLAHKSRYADKETAIGVIVEILNKGQADGMAVNSHWLQKLDDGEDQVWLHGRTGVAISGEFYGFAQNSTTKQRITKASINLRSHGDALFIYSSYPEIPRGT